MISQKTQIDYYFTEGRHYNIQMILVCHKPAQISKTERMSCDTIYITITSNGPDQFDNLNEIYNCKNSFHEIINDFKSKYNNCTDGIDPKL